MAIANALDFWSKKNCPNLEKLSVMLWGGLLWGDFFLKVSFSNKGGKCVILAFRKMCVAMIGFWGCSCHAVCTVWVSLSRGFFFATFAFTFTFTKKGWENAQQFNRLSKFRNFPLRTRPFFLNCFSMLLGSALPMWACVGGVFFSDVNHENGCKTGWVSTPGTAGHTKAHCSREGFVFQLYFFFFIYDRVFSRIFFFRSGGGRKKTTQKKIFFRRCKQGFRLSSWKIFPKP